MTKIVNRVALSEPARSHFGHSTSSTFHNDTPRTHPRTLCHCACTMVKSTATTALILRSLCFRRHPPLSFSGELNISCCLKAHRVVALYTLTVGLISCRGRQDNTRKVVRPSLPGSQEGDGVGLGGFALQVCKRRSRIVCARVRNEFDSGAVRRNDLQTQRRRIQDGRRCRCCSLNSCQDRETLSTQTTRGGFMVRVYAVRACVCVLYTISAGRPQSVRDSHRTQPCEAINKLNRNSNLNRTAKSVAISDAGQ